ncbi:MAG: hypothetical protein ACLQBJ_08500 [Bryobacteraceae bacterium]
MSHKQAARMPGLWWRASLGGEWSSGPWIHENFVPTPRLKHRYEV